ncbi:MAG: hypothetical protein HOJ48_13000 [Desulfobacula sp.]|jgi:hypothetical protein|nr:hypothetical protein [Desulfobacula sp.]
MEIAVTGHDVIFDDMVSHILEQTKPEIKKPGPVFEIVFQAALMVVPNH